MLISVVDKSRSHVANLMRLLDLPQPVREMILQDRLQMGHARALIGHDDAEALALRTEKEGLTLRDVERLVRNARDGVSSAPRRQRSTHQQRSNDPDIMALETQLSDLLGLDIAIYSEGQAGRMTIPYASLDQLDMLCQRLSGGDI